MISRLVCLNPGQKVVFLRGWILGSMLNDFEVFRFCHSTSVAYICGKCLRVSVRVLGTYLMLLLRPSDNLKQANSFCSKGTLRSFLLGVVCDYSEILFCPNIWHCIFVQSNETWNWFVLFQFLWPFGYFYYFYFWRWCHRAREWIFT